jgi:predicted anti-sigma-YlaC factor YlaD
MNLNENSHDPLVERALAGFDLAAEHHLANCAPCQTERERVEEALQLFRAANQEYTNRPEMFWEQQAARIRAAQNERARRSRLAMTLTPGLAVLMLLAFAMLHRTPVPPVQPVAQVDYDHELLVEVERAVQSSTPLSLRAATLMVEDGESSRPMNSTNSAKESGAHEN